MHASFRAGRLFKGFGISFIQLLIVLLLSSLIVSGILLSSGPSWSNYGSASWAAGIVVPQGATLSNGSVDWKTVSNVTSLFRVPNISSTDGTIYIIMSLMTSNGGVMQVAVGLYNSSNSWKGYAMYIPKLNAFPQSYVQVEANKNMSIEAGDMVSMELYKSDGWWFEIKDISAGASTIGRFDANFSSELATGGQYLFALESYSYSFRVFSNMGNLTLYDVFINGQPVINGWYVYKPWASQPLFVVGDSNPPSFISVEHRTNGTFQWSTE